MSTRRLSVVKTQKSVSLESDLSADIAGLAQTLNWSESAVLRALVVLGLAAVVSEWPTDRDESPLGLGETEGHAKLVMLEVQHAIR